MGCATGWDDVAGCMRAGAPQHSEAVCNTVGRAELLSGERFHRSRGPF
jgi:hypothetical protein